MGSKKLRVNSVTSILQQLVALISGMILPRFILGTYGSEVNGLQASITQYLNVITFMELGVVAVVRSAFYKPLAQKDNKGLSRIFMTGQRFFTRLAIILVIYVIVLSFVFPRIVNSPYDAFTTGFLVVAMSLSLFAQYYFGAMNQALLTSDQRYYVVSVSQIITAILNLVLSIIMIKLGVSFPTVKLFSGLVFFLRPVFLNWYVKRNYTLDYTVKADSSAIPQQWNGIAQHIAYVTLNSSDVVILTAKSTLEMVSVYSIYHMITNGLNNLINSISSSLQAFIGNLLAEGKIDELNDELDYLEWGYHLATTFIFALAAALIDSFVQLYTKNVADPVYYQPVFSLVLCIATLSYAIHMFYSAIIYAAGHYRQTQTNSLIQVAVKVVVSLFAVERWGLVGVAWGTLASTLYRLLYLVYYIKDDILNRPTIKFWKNIAGDTILFAAIYLTGRYLPVTINSFKNWVIAAVILAVFGLLYILVINAVIYPASLKRLFRKIKK